MTAYARTITGPTFKLIDVQPGGYVTNFFHRLPPRKQPDGTFVLALPQDPDTPSPNIDMEADYGEYVVGAIERGWEGLETVMASPEYCTAAQLAEAMAKGIVQLSKYVRALLTVCDFIARLVSGKKVVFATQPDEEMHAAIAQRMGPDVATMILNMHKNIRTYGCAYDAPSLFASGTQSS